MENPESPQIFSSLVHPDREKAFKSDAPPKSAIKLGRKETVLACTNCGSASDIEFECVLKKCAGCQREDWPVHKQNCSAELGEGIGPLIKSVVGNPMLSHYMQICLALSFSLHKLPLEKRKQIIGAPMFVHVDVGVEPTMISDFKSMYTYPDDWDRDDIEGMLQFHHMSTPNMWQPPRTLSPRDIAIWERARKQTDSGGDEDSAVVLTQFVNNCRQSISCIFVVGKDAIDDAIHSDGFSVESAITGKTKTKPLSVANCFEYMNTHIRADKKNQLMLRKPMRPSDKELIRDAGRQKDGHAVKMLRFKMSREDIYVTHTLAAVLAGAAERRRASSSSSGVNNQSSRHRQIEGTPTEDEDAGEDRGTAAPDAPKMNRAARRRLEQEQRKAQKKRV